MINQIAADRLLSGRFLPEKFLEIIEIIHETHPEVGEAHITLDYQEFSDEQVEGEVIPYLTIGFRSAVVKIESTEDQPATEEPVREG